MASSKSLIKGSSKGSNKGLYVWTVGKVVLRVAVKLLVRVYIHR